MFESFGKVNLKYLCVEVAFRFSTYFENIKQNDSKDIFNSAQYVRRLLLPNQINFPCPTMKAILSLNFKEADLPNQTYHPKLRRFQIAFNPPIAKLSKKDF
jgi:hypothetical protein